MIDLSRTRAELLAEIEAPGPSGAPGCDITDPHVVTADAHVHLRGHTRADLFPLLKVALSERFAAVPRAVLARDLLMPLRHALGNACKHGNGRDPAKAVAVEVVLTSKGALVAVTDEGNGFDVGLTVQRLRQQQTYFVHQGSGFHALHGATSPVTWDNGGRTMLLCFRPSIDEPDAPFRPMRGGHPSGGAGEDPDEDPALRRLLDPAWMQTRLSRELPAFQHGGAKLESCHSYVSSGLAGDDCGIRYVLRVTSRRARPAETHILTGRLHAEEATAAADFEAASALRGGQRSKRLRIPEPVARLMAERRLVLYNFDPWMNLWQYLRYRGSLEALRHAATRIGEALAALHRSPVALRLVKSNSVGARLQAMVAGGQRALRMVPRGSRLVNRFRVCVQRIQDRAPVRRHRARAPIHGALGWDCIHYGADGRFYLYRFETCQQSDPAIDLGGFAADLLRFTLASNDIAAYHACRDDFLTSYNSRAEHPLDEDALPLYIALAIGERLPDASSRTTAEIEHLLEALEAAGAG